MLIQVKICTVHRSLTSRSRGLLVSKASGFLAKSSTLQAAATQSPAAAGPSPAGTTLLLAPYSWTSRALALPVPRSRKESGGGGTYKDTQQRI